MKRIALGLILAALLLIPGAAFAQNASWDGYYHKGDFTLEAGLGFGGYRGVFSLALLPGAEWTIADWKIGGTVPLAVGAAGKGFVEVVPGEGIGFGVGGFGVAHMGLRGLDIPEFLQKLDWYVGLGLGALIVPFADPSFGITIPIVSGASYFLKDNLAVYLEGIWWVTWSVYGYGGAALGIRLRK